MSNRADVDRLTHPVHCHVCPGGWSAEKLGLPKDTDQHPRYVSRLIGSTRYGGLWHCPEHNDTPLTADRFGRDPVHECGCPHGDWTEDPPTGAQLQRWEASREH